MAIISDNVITVRDFQSIGMLNGGSDELIYEKKKERERTNGGFWLYGPIMRHGFTEVMYEVNFCLKLLAGTEYDQYTSSRELSKIE